MILTGNEDFNRLDGTRIGRQDRADKVRGADFSEDPNSVRERILARMREAKPEHERNPRPMPGPPQNLVGPASPGGVDLGHPKPKVDDGNTSDGGSGGDSGSTISAVMYLASEGALVNVTLKGEIMP